MGTLRNVFGLTFLQFKTLVAAYDLSQKRGGYGYGIYASDIKAIGRVNYPIPKLNRLVELGYLIKCGGRRGFFRVTKKGADLVERWRREIA